VLTVPLGKTLLLAVRVIASICMVERVTLIFLACLKIVVLLCCNIFGSTASLEWACIALLALDCMLMLGRERSPHGGQIEGALA
jgi:hypothetical protein